MIIVDDSIRIKKRERKRKLKNVKGQAKIKNTYLKKKLRRKMGKRIGISLRKKLECQ